MSHDDQQLCPFTSDILSDPVDSSNNKDDPWPASYVDYLGSEGPRGPLDAAKNAGDFLDVELSIQRLDRMLKYLWMAGSRVGPPSTLHFQIAMNRRIILVERMDLHLVLDDEGNLFLKPIPRFLLKPEVWQNELACPSDCVCGLKVAGEGVGPASRRASQASRRPSQGETNLFVTDNAATENKKCMRNHRNIARGFLYTYTALLSSETDYHLANERRLLPRKGYPPTMSSPGDNETIIPWRSWKVLVRELISSHSEQNIHPRFRLAELRLTRLNVINRFIIAHNPLASYRRSWRNHRGFFRGHITWMLTASVFLALVLNAMQVGLATDRLQHSQGFHKASFGFTVFSITGPIAVLCAVVLVALFDLVTNFRDRGKWTGILREWEGGREIG